MRNIALGVCMLSATLISVPAFAQSAPTPTVAPTVKPVATNSVLSSNLIGLKVANAGNETIGEVKDLVLGTGNMLTGVILSVGGFLGMGEHYVVIDPSSIAVSYNEADKKWEARVNTTKDHLKASPAFIYEGKWK